MTTEFKPNHNPTAETILDFAGDRDNPSYMIGFDEDGHSFIQVEFDDPYGEPKGEIWSFDTHEAAMAVFLDLRNRMVDETRKRTFRHQLETLQVSGRCDVAVSDRFPGIKDRFPGRENCQLIFGRSPGSEGYKLAVGATVPPDRSMKDQRSLDRLVEAVEQFIKTEGL